MAFDAKVVLGQLRVARYTGMVMGIPEKLATLPQKPGVYLFRDRQGKTLYVGKAKNLAHRVRSYFQSARQLEPAKELMVRRVADLEWIIVSSEEEAFLLESTLIQKHQPPFNIDLKDDKYFLYLKLNTRVPYPTLETVRRPTDRGARYFGPYTSAGAVRHTVKLLKRLFRFRTCRPEQGKPCFDYTLGRCWGVCIGAITPAVYRRQVVRPIIAFLKGERETIADDLRKQMKTAAEVKRFEVAAAIRDQLWALERLERTQKVVSPKRENEDLASFLQDGRLAAFNVFLVRIGKLVDRQTFIVQNSLELPPSELLAGFLRQYYVRVPEPPKRVIIGIEPEDMRLIEKQFRFRLKKAIRGKRWQLLQLGVENARDALEREKRAIATDEQRALTAISELQKALKLPKPPQRIEAYDISNVQGTNPVGSMVVFLKGLPAKQHYRKFSIKTVRGVNDPAMMAEVLCRRLMRLEEGPAAWPKPDCILLDGGLPQLNAVRSVMERAASSREAGPRHRGAGSRQGGDSAVAFAALAKREEELYLPNRAKPLRLPRDSEALFLLERIRDEAHRFAIGFHRKKRGAAAVRSALDDVPGIGPVTKKRLLETFGSVRGVQEANKEELTRVIGTKAAKRIHEGL